MRLTPHLHHVSSSSPLNSIESPDLKIKMAEANTNGKGSAKKIETRLLINGRLVESSAGKTFEVVNPATEEVVAHGELAQLLFSSAQCAVMSF